MTTFTDDFNRADSSNLGAGWTEVSGDWSIASNQLSPGNAGGTIILRTATAMATDDNSSQITVATTATASQGVWCRGDATIANGYLWRNNGTSWDLFSVIGGSFLNIATFAAAAANGDVMKVQAVGTTIKGFVNGVERASVTDVGVVTGKNVGVRSESTSGLRYDNFTGADVGSGADVPATLAGDGGAHAGTITATPEVLATLTGTGGSSSAALTATREVPATLAGTGGAHAGALAALREVPAALGGLGAAHAGTIDVQRETAAVLAGAGGAHTGHITVPDGGELERPNATVVAKAWLATIAGISASRVANELPMRNDWPGPVDGFITVTPLVSSPELYVPLQHPIVQFDCWGVFGGSSKRPNHGVANNFAELIRAAADATTWTDAPEVTLPVDVMPVWLADIYVVRGVTRVPDDNFAHYSLDVHIGWIEREALAGVTG